MTANSILKAYPHRYKLAGAGYCKKLAVQRRIKHRIRGNFIYTAKPL